MSYATTPDRDNDVLRCAQKQGILHGLINLHPVDRNVLEMLGAMQKVAPAGPPPQFENPYTAPDTQQYHEHNYENNNFDADTEAAIELARFCVPYGAVGVVKNIDYFWRLGTNTYTDNEYWGDINPAGYGGGQSHLNNALYLRLYPFDGTQPPRWNSATFQLPGSPYPEKPNWNEMLHKLESYGTRVNLVVPGGYMLRWIYYQAGDNNTTVRVWGKLAGYMQTRRHPYTKLNLDRMNW